MAHTATVTLFLRVEPSVAQRIERYRAAMNVGLYGRAKLTRQEACVKLMTTALDAVVDKEVRKRPTARKVVDGRTLRRGAR